MIINRIYETQNLLSLKLVSFLLGLRTCQYPCTVQAMKGVASRMPQTLKFLSCREEPFRTLDEILTSLTELFIDILVPKMQTVSRYVFSNLLLLYTYSNGSSLCSLSY